MCSKIEGKGATMENYKMKWAFFLFILAIRFLPLFKSSVPLGYDPGFYKYTMEIYSNALPQIPETNLADWIKDMYPQGLFVLSDVMSVVTGTGSMDHIYYFDF